EGGDGVCDGFFFQAEDGIRDRNVTGVQTCALPIWPRRRRGPGGRTGSGAAPTAACRARRPAAGGRPGGPRRRPAPAPRVAPAREIGRASCRERVWVAGVAGAVEAQITRV